MNTGNLKSYAPQARKDFIAAVTARANLLGLSDNNGALKAADAEVKNDIVMIAGRPWPVKVHEQRRKLIERIKLTSFTQTMEAAAYAWFNRLAALRFMELHDYLGHGRQVLSNPTDGLPEVLTHALDLAEAGALPGLLPHKVRELKLANQDAELYRQVLIAQCNALHTAMPFLFEAIGDETELLLPENLLLTDSVVAKLVQSIPEDDWQQIEILGWLYQFYISEKKDQVIGKVVKSEDIPAATQLFTPNWIVKYMVQNSLGAQWLATYPDSSIRAQMEYYIEPAEQTDEVNAQLAAVTPSSLDPEALTLIDPACGSGHILVEAYELFKAIYLERGYRQQDVAKLILEKNLFGLDIDERAAQLTGFALMMKARADDRRLFERGVKLNVMALQDSTGFDADQLAQGFVLANYGLKLVDLTGLKELFAHATTFGSLIQVPEQLAEKLSALDQLREATGQDFFVSDALKQLSLLVQQAQLLTSRYDVVVANPPYMGSKFYSAILKKFVNEEYAAGKSDLYGAFILRNIELAKDDGRIGMITIPNWMFLSSFEQLRDTVSEKAPISSLVHNGRGVWGPDFGSSSYVLWRGAPSMLCGRFLRLFEKLGSISSNAELKRRFHVYPRFSALNTEFKKIPGSPVAYWLSKIVLNSFCRAEPLSATMEFRKGMGTGANETFVRNWQEVSFNDVCIGASSNKQSIASKRKWFPYNSGGKFRRWYGNNELVVKWFDDGAEVKSRATELNHGGHWSRYIVSTSRFFVPGVTWTAISSSKFGVRRFGQGFLFSSAAMCGFGHEDRIDVALALLNSKVAITYLKILAPTLNFGPTQVQRIPLFQMESGTLLANVDSLVGFARADWDAFERSWDFRSSPLLVASTEATPTLESCYAAWLTQSRAIITEVKRLEEENNRLFVDAYGLADEVTSDVSIEQITLTVNPAYRYGSKVSEEEQWTRFREDAMQELISYAIGCMMGRYSLDEPSLIYANAGNVGFDASRYTSFPADADGIVPLTEDLWFEDDAALRVREFVQVAWGAEKLDENIAWLAEGLGQKASESPDDAIRRYLADKFFKDHLQTYKKRPIYWLFSSGKQGAFQALVYLHRYNAGTLSRLRAEYVVPLTGKMQSRIEQREKDVAASSSTAARNRASKQLESLRKKHIELLAYDEKLRHYADQRVELDLDDGVKVNYGKFGDLLAEVKAVTGGKGDDE